ncbi:MAG: hypothetical protein IT449_03550 [Phycisphaerales bacterium]|nr:hypothetical protein [Phycisphaerales bacterium]
MPSKRLKHAIAMDAARLLYERQETDVHRARLRAAVMNGVHPKRRPRDLPSGRDIRECVDEITLEREGDAQPANARERHLATLKLMWLLERFEPRWIPAEGEEGKDSSLVELELVAASADDVRSVLDAERFPYVLVGSGEHTADADEARGQVPRGGGAAFRFHLRSARGHVLEFRLVVNADRRGSHGSQGAAGSSHGDQPAAGSSFGGDSIPSSMTLPQVESWVPLQYPDANLGELRAGEETWADPYIVFELLLQRLEGVKQKAEYHPEGDALYHSLQAFDLAREQFSYDEEFLQAALLHDVGKGIDPARHIDAALAALRGLISPRTVFLIEFHSAARHLRDGTLTGRLRQHLLESEWREDLMALLEIDDAARRPGVPAPTVGEAIAYLRSLNEW